MSFRPIAHAVLCVATLLLVAPPVLGFTFADGTHADCVARGLRVVEIDAAPGDEVYRLGRTALVTPTSSGYRITWNMPKLNSLPAEVHDFIFFHECAHARVPTQDELKANCVGLKEMRAAGRAGFAVETKLGAFYGPRSAYWENTLKCAAAGAGSPSQ
jgi:hypothetical protein